MSMTDAEGARLRRAVAGTFFMGRGLAVLASVAACAWLSFAQPVPQQLASVRAIHALSSAQASQGLPVDFQATTTYVRSSQHALFVQDGDAAVYVDWPTESLLEPGDRVEIIGTTKAGFRPTVLAKSVTLVHHGTLPAATPATFDQLIRGDMDAKFVTVEATVRDATTVVHQNVRSTLLPMHA